MARMKYNHKPQHDLMAQRLFDQARLLAGRMDTLEYEEVYGIDEISMNNTDKVIELIERIAEICVEARVLDATERHRIING